MVGRYITPLRINHINFIIKVTNQHRTGAPYHTATKRAAENSVRQTFVHVSVTPPHFNDISSELYHLLFGKKRREIIQRNAFQQQLPTTKEKNSKDPHGFKRRNRDGNSFHTLGKEEEKASRTPVNPSGFLRRILGTR
uniref:Pecanex-like protein 2 n=1 Tax=Lygus hesperus TaxID=30085 RepID=A0A0A9Z9C7_LYGHE